MRDQRTLTDEVIISKRRPLCEKEGQTRPFERRGEKHLQPPTPKEHVTEPPFQTT